MLGILLPAFRVALVTWLVCGIVYPLAVTGLGQWLLPFQVNGSLEKSPDGVILGSRLIGQQWTGPEWFHGRPSATTRIDPDDPAVTISAPYNAANSGGSNLGPTSKRLAKRISADRRALEKDATRPRRSVAARGHADNIGFRAGPGYKSCRCCAPGCPHCESAWPSERQNQCTAGSAHHRSRSPHFRGEAGQCSRVESRA